MSLIWIPLPCSRPLLPFSKSMSNRFLWILQLILDFGNILSFSNSLMLATLCFLQNSLNTFASMAFDSSSLSPKVAISSLRKVSRISSTHICFVFSNISLLKLARKFLNSIMSCSRSYYRKENDQKTKLSFVYWNPSEFFLYIWEIINLYLNVGINVGQTRNVHLVQEIRLV